MLAHEEDSAARGWELTSQEDVNYLQAKHKRLQFVARGYPDFEYYGLL